MQFLVHGADQKTGRELTIVIDARDRTEAEQRVLYNDILIASVAHFAAGAALPPRPAPLPVRDVRDEQKLDYGAAEEMPEQRTPRSRPPFYETILYGARWLAGLAVAVRIVGFVALICAAAVVLVPVIGPVRRWMPFQIVPVLWYLAGGLLLASGFVCLLCGAFVSMMSGLSLAVRDMARNSFREESPGENPSPSATGRVRVARPAPAELVQAADGQLLLTAGS